ncbi:ParB/Srx family N-terminal domain-containing protein [Rhizobium sp. YTUHZ045]|uniref:ParB/RepB/Spo0J family partition protein n=1 Tax=Rhizobium sp. YTUHZ045 TaxID=2962888 RepID=UPI003DAA122D
MEQLSLTTDRLVLDSSNARKMRDKDSLASLKASILAHGIIQPITVRPPAAADRDLEGDRYRVFAGGRRLTAVTELIFEGKLPADYELPALIKDVDDTGADEMSLAENILRRAMRPVDEFKAFSRLADEGATADDIALRFGQTVRFVQGRMALGRLHPVLLEMLDQDEIRLETAMAYTLEPDPERQLNIYNNLPDWKRTSSVYIKEAISGTGTKSNGGLAKFIGETRYILAGGKITNDLFEDHSFWVSSEIVEKLKVEKIEEMKSELLAAGWAWVKTAEELGNDLWYMDTLRPEESGLPVEQQERLEELQAQLEEFDEVDIDELPADEQERFRELDAEHDELSKLAKGRHSAEQRAQSGVVIRTDRDYCLDFGKLPRGTTASSSSSPKAEKDPLAISAPVLSELGKAATVALAEAVEAQPDKALALLAALLELGPTSPWQQHRPGRISIAAPGVTVGGFQGVTAKRSYSEAFEEYAAMKAVDLKKALARLVAGAVDISQEWLSSNASMRTATLETFDVDPTPHFDVDSFFTAARKPIIAAAYKEMTGQDLKDGKKGDMVAIAVDAAKKTGWLPEYLRTATYKPKKSK